ncbi:peptidylprolyl isomerase [Chloroflexales bacterium ZM16-3]|nr:peptidylprolyl isomerase [Chloroflexales bacterium ZM16-3]
MTDPHSADAPETQNDDPDILDETTTSGSSRRVIALIGGALVLLIIGAGLAMIFAPGPSAPAAAIAPTTATTALTNATPAASDLPTPSVPTALPLPQAIGDMSSTEPVAQVGDTMITRGEFVQAYQPGTPPGDVLKQLIQVELVLQAAKAEGVIVDQSKIDDQIVQIKQQNAINDAAAFDAFLQQNNIASEDALRGIIARSQLLDQMLMTHTTIEQAHVRHIMLMSSGDQSDARKAEAEALLKQIQDGADFAQLASEKSEDTNSKDEGGDLGWIPQGIFGLGFDEALFSMKQGELRVVQSQYGWHVIELLDLPEVRGLDNTDLLSTAPGQQALNDTFLPWVDQLQSTAEAAQQIKILVTDDQLVTTPGA